jgi:hypothetical protein
MGGSQTALWRIGKRNTTQVGCTSRALAHQEAQDRDGRAAHGVLAHWEAQGGDGQGTNSILAHQEAQDDASGGTSRTLAHQEAQKGR